MYDWVNAEGTSGGLLSMWDPGSFKVLQSTKHKNFLIVSGTAPQVTGLVHYANVYAPQGLGATKDVWNILTEHIETNPGLWVIMGDFNSVRTHEERRNSDFNPACADAFNEFIEDNGLLEFPMGGRKFTRVSDDGKKFSKLDRFLVNQAFWDKWPDSKVLALPRRDSDHSPIVLSTESVNFGSYPFRFFNSWLSSPGFDEVVKGAVEGVSFQGRSDERLANKLKAIKNAIKNWVSLVILTGNRW